MKEKKRIFKFFPTEIFGSLGFVLCRERRRSGLARSASARRRCRYSLSLSWLSKHPPFRAGSRDRLWVGGRLGTCFPGLGRRARRSPLVPRGKVSSLSISSPGCGEPKAATTLPPGRLPLSGVGTRVRPAPRLLFRIPISLQSALFPSLRRRRARPGPGPGSPFQLGPARVLAPIVGLAGATRWTPTAVLGCELSSAKARRDSPSGRGSPRGAPLPSPQLERQDGAA